jgi:isoquinoline 1-oxidoreductase alpha subunit
MTTLTINEKTHDVDADPNTPLLWVLREWVGMTGTKYGCGIAQCGACTVLLDGIATRSCVTPLSLAAGKQITTIEGLQQWQPASWQKAWLGDVPQCGYCQSGMIMAGWRCSRRKLNRATDAVINSAVTNICRCGTFQQVRAAIHAAANA